METTSVLPNAVQWSEGLLLSPQHLQQNDIYWHEQLRYRLASINPHYWGVKQLTVDPAGLVSGKVVVTALDCILPDGLPVIYPADYTGATLFADVSKLAKTDGRAVRIWLQVNQRGPAAAQSDNANRRYNSLPGILTSDENIGPGDMQVAVGRLQTHIELYAADAATPAPAGRIVCPLLDVERDAEGHLRIAAYHPPMLQLGASAFQNEQGLQHQLLQLKQTMWSKIEELVGVEAVSGTDDKPDIDAAPGPHLSAARHLATALPQLDIAIAAQDRHPYELYRALALVVGQLACIGTNPVPLKMQAYRHEDCMPQFQSAFDYINAKLTLINTAYECLKFMPMELPGIGLVRFARGLTADMSQEVVVELKRRDGQSIADLTDWLGDALIVSRSLIEVAQRGRLVGKVKPRALSPQEIKERGLPPQTDLFLIQNWQLHVEGKGLQDAFRPDTALLIHGAENANMPASIILYRKKRLKHGATAPAPAPAPASVPKPPAPPAAKETQHV